MSEETSQFEELLKADTASMSVEFMAYGAVIGLIVGIAGTLILQDMVQAVFR